MCLKHFVAWGTSRFCYLGEVFLWTVLMHLGWDWIISKSGVICVYMWWGDVSCHGCMRNLPTFMVLLGVSTSSGPHSPRNSCCVGTSAVYTCTHACVGTLRSCLPVMPMFHFDYRKEYTHVLLLCGFGDTALACHALRDSELPLLKRMVFKEPRFPILLPL